MSKARKKITSTREGTISLCEAELMCRMVEAALGEKRPRGMTAEYVVTRMLDQRSREQYSAVAQAAIRYLTERLDDATQATVAGEMVTLN